MTVGIDEVGRGALAGPAVVGAALAPQEALLDELLESCGLLRLTDSKKMTAARRERVADFISGRLPVAVGLAAAAEIDRLGLSAALRLAAGRALDEIGSQIQADITLIQADAGLFHPYPRIETVHTVRGDERIPAIGIASIVAKVWRDRYMAVLSEEFPHYGFERHAGYGTAFHFEALQRYGMSPHHRSSFLKKRGLS